MTDEKELLILLSGIRRAIDVLQLIAPNEAWKEALDQLASDANLALAIISGKNDE